MMKHEADEDRETVRGTHDHLFDNDDAPEAGLPEFLTVPEVAALLRIAPNTVYDLHSRGLIPGGRRVGRSIRFHRDTVIQWFRSQDRGSPPSRRPR